MEEWDENKPYGGFSTYESYVEDMNEHECRDCCIIYKDKEYWFIHCLVGSHKYLRPGISVYYADCDASDAVHNKQAVETRQEFEGDDIRPVIEKLVMHDGRPFKEILKEPHSIEWT